MGALEHGRADGVFADALEEVDTDIFASFAAGDPNDGRFYGVHGEPLNGAQTVLAHQEVARRKLTLVFSQFNLNPRRFYIWTTGRVSLAVRGYTESPKVRFRVGHFFASA